MPNSSVQKRPDIILYADDKPLLVIENKIDAAFTSAANTEARPSHSAKGMQLEDYQAWLRSQSQHGIVVLLTHLTPPPTRDDAPHIDFMRLSVIRWSALYKYLVKDGGPHWRNATPDASTLVNEFTKFLKECDMAQEDPTATDFAAARLFYTTDAETRKRCAQIERTHFEVKVARHST
jgi:hypothetical protein